MKSDSSKLSFVSRVLGHVRRPMFVLRRADAFGEEAFEKWLRILRDGMVAAIVEIDMHLGSEREPMREEAKESAVAVAVDMLEREFQLDGDTAERLARRVMSTILPPLEREVDRLNQERQRTLISADHTKDRVAMIMDRFGQTIDSMLAYARQIGGNGRRGHYVDVPIDDRTAYELEGLLRDWQSLGGQRYRHPDLDSLGEGFRRFYDTQLKSATPRAYLSPSDEVRRIVTDVANSERIRHAQQSDGNRRPTET